MEISQYNKGEYNFVAQYNANNSWLYNGTNGTLNNNNKYNSYGVRSTLEFYDTTGSLGCDFVVPLEEWYQYYRICKKKKSNKPSHLIFALNFAHNIIDICNSVGNFEYIPRESICFVITEPRLREVIAADFGDRIVQTYFVQHVMPLLEQHFLHKDSYACRVGKGGLRAVQQLQEYIYDESLGYTRDIWLAKVDLQGFFMSIDTSLTTEKLNDFINKYVSSDSEKNLLKYLSLKIYQSLPQKHCRLKSPKWLMDALPDNKKMYGKEDSLGVAIGNVTSQMIACFVTTFYLDFLQELGYKYVHYTDDTAIVVTDKEKWLSDIKSIREYLSNELHLTLHPKKNYLQHYSKGIEFVGFKIRFNRILPSDRIVRNFRNKISEAIHLSEEFNSYVYKESFGFAQVINSYLGLLKWCNSKRLIRKEIDRLKNSLWKEVLNFAEDYSKVNVKASKSVKLYYVKKNKKRKEEIKKA